jgi:hypothetical protein
VYGVEADMEGVLTTTTRRLLTAAACGLALLAGLVAPPASAAPEPGEWGPQRILQEDPFLVQVDDVTVLNDGRVLTLWEQGGDEDAIWASTRPAGGPWSAPRRLSLPGHWALDSLAVASGSAGATVFWEDDGPAPGLEFWSRRLRADGTWARAGLITRSTTNVVDLVADRNAAGDMAIAWTARGSRVQAAVRRAGGSWQVSDPQPSQSGPDGVVVDAGAAVTVVFRAPCCSQRRSAIWASDVRGNGSWSTPVRLGPTLGATLAPPWQPIEVDDNARGDVAIAWAERDEDGVRSFVRSRAVGHDWSARHQLPGRSTAAKVGVGRAGQLVAGWVDRSDGTAIRLARADADGRWGATQTLLADDRDLYAFTTDLDVNGDGDALLGYRTGRRHVIARCLAGGECLQPALPVPPHWYDVVDIALGPRAAAVAVWASGCRTEACYATAINARLLGPPA